MEGGENFSFRWLRIIAIFAQIILSASQGPNDAVARSGEDVTFTYSSNSLSDKDYFSWTVHPGALVIYQSGGRQPDPDPNKYIVINGNGSFVLTVKAVTRTDPRTYCFFSQQMTKSACANLVVLESLIPSVDPSTDLTNGQVVNLTCVLNYGGPTTDSNNIKPLSSEQNPQLTMSIGSTQITYVPPGQQIIGTDQTPHQKSISANQTIVAAYADQSFVCQVTTTTPPFTYTNSTFLRVKYATSSAKISWAKNSTNSSCCQVNDVLNCTANGYPYPIIKWKNSAGSDITPSASGNGYAAITITSSGTYPLNCSAKNEAASIWSNTTYMVYPAGSPNNPDAGPIKGTGNNTALGVGLGVGLGVPVLIGIIVLAVVLSRRKKAAKPIAVKQPEKNTNAAQVGKSPNGKGPEPGSKNNVNPNPNPTYYTPVMPDQTGAVAPKSVRDSPGYGDLGVRHLGGSGSNPHLNESFDSQVDKSFDSSRNGPSGANLQFVGGRTSHSSSAPNTSV